MTATIHQLETHLAGVVRQFNQVRQDMEDNVIEFQKRGDLHRYFAPGVIEHHKEPMTLLERILLCVIFATSIAIVCMVLGWGLGEIKSADWSGVAELFGGVK